MSFFDHGRRETRYDSGARPALVARVAAGLTLACTYFVYAPCLRFQFVYDDIFQIVNNPHLDSWRFLPVYFTQHVWSHVPGIAANFYRPLFLLWLRLNNIAFGHEAAGWHFTTLLLHLIVIGLVYLLARSLTANGGAALASALVFGLHPVHVEAVAWVSGATEPLGAAFFLGSMLCYLPQRAAGNRRKLWLAASLALFCAGLLVKETVAVLPLVILAYEFTLGRQSVSAPKAIRVRRELLPYWIVLVVYLLTRTLVVHGLASNSTPNPLVWSLLTWPWLLCFYLRLLFWPAHLSPLYNPVLVRHLTQSLFLVPLLVLAVGAVALSWLIRRSRSRLPAFLAAWFLLTLAPALVVFCVARPDEAFHDRYLYLPSVAFALAAGALFSRLGKGAAVSKALAAAATVAVVLLMALGIHRQLGYWASNYALFQRAAAVAPGNETAKLNFAAELIKTREYQRALRLSEQSAALDPDSARAWGSAAAAAFYLGDYPQAEKNYARAAMLDPSRADLLYYLGITRMKLGKYAEAAEALRQAAAASPRLKGVHYAFGLAETHLGQWEDAAQQFAAELRTDPQDHNAQKALAEAQAHLQKNQGRPKLLPAASLAATKSALAPTVER